MGLRLKSGLPWLFCPQEGQGLATEEKKIKHWREKLQLAFTLVGYRISNPKDKIDVMLPATTTVASLPCLPPGTSETTRKSSTPRVWYKHQHTDTQTRRTLGTNTQASEDTHTPQRSNPTSSFWGFPLLGEIQCTYPDCWSFHKQSMRKKKTITNLGVHSVHLAI